MRRSSNDTVYAGANDAITLGNGNDTLAFGVGATTQVGLDTAIQVDTNETGAPRVWAS